MTGKKLTTNNKFDFSAIQNADLSPNTKYRYQKALQAYLDTGAKLSDFKALQAHALTLCKSNRAFLKAAVRLISKEYELFLKGAATPENVDAVQASVYRLEAMNSAIRVKASKGDTVHTWLTPAQVREMLSHCSGTDLRSIRDWTILALLVGAGLRRDELTHLKFDDIKELPNGKGKRYVLQVKGKGKKNRAIPIQSVLGYKVRLFQEYVEGDLVARSLGRNNKPGASISGQAILDLVRKYGVLIGVPKLDPHDLRRTFAQIGYDAGIPITQLSLLLGHSNTAVTERYLNIQLDLDTNVSDFVPLE